MNAVEGNLEMIVKSLCDSGVDYNQAYKFLNYCTGDELESMLTMIVGSKVLCKKDLDNIGISRENIKLSRYIYLIINEKGNDR